MIGVQAQGTWNAPEVPGVDPTTLGADDVIYVYNVEADVFMNYGMNWDTQAIATKLETGDQAASDRHKCYVKSVSGQTIKMASQKATNKFISAHGAGASDVWVDQTDYAEWTLASSGTNTYTLTNTGRNKKLDVSWTYGGKLTVVDGQGFFDWAFIPVANITNGSYAKYKERKAMFSVYESLNSAGHVSDCTAALETANAVYTNANASVSDLRTATATLITAVADYVEEPFNAAALFENADIRGNWSSAGWGVTGGLDWGGVMEKWHATFTLTQTATVPNGLYDIVFHGMFRQDGSDAAPKLSVTGSETKEVDVPNMVALGPSWSCNTNNNGWATNSGTNIPDDRRTAGQGLTYGGAVAHVNNVAVKNGSLTITVDQKSTSQWFMIQCVDIIYNGPVNVAIYKRLMEKKGEAEALVNEPMDPAVLSNLEDCIAVAETMTPNSDEDDLNNAYNNLVDAINDAEVSIDLTAHITAITDNKGDITSLINGTFQDNADGWNGGNRVTGLARGWRGADVTEPFYERTTAGVMSCTIPNMPAGTYKVVAAWRSINGGQMTPAIAGTDGTTVTGTGDAAPAEGTKEINTNGVEMPYSTLGGFTTNDLGHNWKWITVTGTLAADGDLVLSFTTSGTAGWNAIDDVHLYCTNLGGTPYTRTVGDGKGTINANTSAVTVDIILENPNTILRTTGAITTAAGQSMNNDQYNSSRITKLVLYDGYDFANSGDNYGLDYGATLYREIPADTWCTLMVPFYPTNLDEKKVPVSLEEGVLSFGNAPAKDMNDSPMLVKSTEGVTAITGLRNSTYGINKGTGSYGEGAPMQGVYVGGTVPKSGVSATNYVVNSNNLYKVDSDVNIKPFRAYFTVAGESEARLTLRIDGEDPTAINAVEAAEANDGALKDGKYLIEGKIVLVKNGVKYGANGQKLN